MRYRKLGKTGIDIGIVGLGAEYLEHASRDTIISVVHEAIDHKVNYIDLFMASPDVRDNFGIAVKNSRNKVIVAGHLGPILKNGQYSKSRNNEMCEKYFDDLLIRLQTDYIDILMLHFVDEPDDYEKVFNPGGLLELAIRLKKEGKARFIGMSSHKAPVALTAVNSGHIDVLMFSINPADDPLPGDIRLKNVLKKNLYNRLSSPEDESTLERKKLYHTCAIQEVGLVAMKPYAAGVLFRENPSSIILTPVQCINYALSQPGVCTVVPGCKNVTEMKAALAFLDATDDDRIQYRKQAKEEGIASILSVPVMLREEVVGVIRVYTAEPRHFTDADTYYIGAVANLGAIALENARLYDSVKKDYEALRMALAEWRAALGYEWIAGESVAPVQE